MPGATTSAVNSFPSIAFAFFAQIFFCTAITFKARRSATFADGRPSSFAAAVPSSGE